MLSSYIFLPSLSLSHSPHVHANMCSNITQQTPKTKQKRKINEIELRFYFSTVVNILADVLCHVEKFNILIPPSPLLMMVNQQINCLSIMRMSHSHKFATQKNNLHFLSLQFPYLNINAARNRFHLINFPSSSELTKNCIFECKHANVTHKMQFLCINNFGSLGFFMQRNSLKNEI